MKKTEVKKPKIRENKKEQAARIERILKALDR